ncbi:MAG: biotin/lipoyl-binding protein [Actinobacteria bacterium]|nr:biotin/lipoyl-binding protein [Actinomycetota bacterium]
MTTENTEAVATPRRRFRMTPKRWIGLALAIALLAGAGVGTYLLLRPKTTAATTFSRTVEVAKGTQTQTVTLDGTLSPRTQSDVNFTVSGTVTSVKVTSGDKVTKGQKLARIDDSELQNAVDLAEANVTTAKANLSEVYDNDGSSAAITSAKAQVTSAQAALASAQDDLDAAVLRSPISGTVASVNLEVGDTVGSSSGGSGSSGSASTTSSTSSAQFVIIGTSTWKVEGSVGAADLGSVKAGQAVSVTTDATTDPLTGTVASVGIVATSTSDDGTATFPVVITLSGTHTDLYSGTTATAVITTGTYDDVLTVPTAAIRTENGKTVVTKVTDGTNSTVEVEVGTVFGSSTQVTSGLSEGDTVLITFTRPSSTSTSSTEQQGGGFGGGFGGGLDGGGPPGGGAPPGGTGQGGR